MTEENKPGGLSTTPAQQAFNKAVQEGEFKPQSLDAYIAEGQKRGAIPQNLTDAQRAEIAKTFNRVKQG